MNRPRPVLTSAGITGGIQGIASILTFLGYSNAATSLDGESQTIISVVLGVITLGGNLLHGLHAQAKVTPVDAPQAADGTPLVKAPTTSPVAMPPTAAQVVAPSPVPSIADQVSQTLNPGA